jgi:hypothetical protein
MLSICWSVCLGGGVEQPTAHHHVVLQACYFIRRASTSVCVLVVQRVINPLVACQVVINIPSITPFT